MKDVQNMQYIFTALVSCSHITCSMTKLNVTQWNTIVNNVSDKSYVKQFEG